MTRIADSVLDYPHERVRRTFDPRVSCEQLRTLEQLAADHHVALVRVTLAEANEYPENLTVGFAEWLSLPEHFAHCVERLDVTEAKRRALLVEREAARLEAGLRRALDKAAALVEVVRGEGAQGICREDLDQIAEDAGIDWRCEVTR